MRMFLLSLVVLSTSAFSEGLQLQSTAFTRNGPIPEKYTCTGNNDIPPLSWQAIAGAKSYVLIVDDPDAPNGDMVHWLVFNIPGSVTQLSGTESYPMGSNGRGNNFYQGPCPNQGTHRYFFKMYALDTYLKLQSPNKQQLLKAMDTHILQQDTLMGTFSR
jgi:hypothetical protein